MLNENNINDRWTLLEEIIGIDKLKHKFDAYSRFTNEDWTIEKEEHWHGWWNENFDFVTIWAKSKDAKIKLQEIERVFAGRGWTIEDGIINGGICLTYKTMTAEESKKKAYDNLLNGGRMSD